MKGKKILKIIICILLFIFAIVTCLTILNNPNITGLSDNGDFSRVTLPNNITYNGNTNDNGDVKYFFQNTYIMNIIGNNTFDIVYNIFNENENNIHEYTSSQFSFIKLSKLLNYISNSINNKDTNIYDISFLSIIYIVILSIAFVLLYKSFETENILKNILILIVLSIVFFDLGYIIYFNSFYGEALQYCSFMLINAILFYTIHSYKENWKLSKFNCFLLFVFYIFTYIFACSKSANVPIGIIYAVCGFILCSLCTENLLKIFLSLASIICISFSAMYLTTTPSWMTKVTNYNSVFYGILKNSKNPNQDLFDLDINQRYISLSNTNAYNGEYKYDISSNKFEENVYDTISKAKIFKYYLLHPDRFFEKLSISLENARVIKPMYLGNYLYTDNNIKIAQNTNYSLWSNFRNNINVTNVYVFCSLSSIVMITLLSGVYIFKKNTNKFSPKITVLGSSHILELIMLLTIFISMCISLVLPFMANGEADLQKHMFLFNNIYDLIIVCFIIYFIKYIDKFVQYLLKHKVQLIITIIIVLSFTFTIIVLNLNSIPSTVKEISFGTYNNKEIIWQIIDETDDKYLLITKEPVFKDKFDNKNSNYWINSSIRKRLNDELYNSFSKNEKNKIISNDSKVLLAQNYKSQKEKGVLPYYWNPYTKLQDNNIDRYYQTNCTDKIFLLNSFEYNKYISTNNISTKTNMVFMTPYVNNYTMIRYISENGYVYINDSNIEYNIYPCIWLKK